MDHKQKRIAIIIIAIIGTILFLKPDIENTISQISILLLEVFSMITLKRIIIFAVIIAVLIIALNAKSFLKTIEDRKITGTIKMILDWIECTDEISKKEFQNEYAKNSKNVCFGTLFYSKKPISFYLAFSDESHISNSIGKEFSSISDKISHIYCQYSDSELKEKVPIAILDPDFEPVYLDQLNSRQKTHQSCSERKIIARLLDDHMQILQSDIKEQLHLILLTKFAPCEFCHPFIKSVNDKYKNKLNIKVLHIDYLQLMIEHKEELIAIKKKHEKPLSLINRLLVLLPKEKSKTESKSNNASSKESRNFIIKKLESISYKQCKELAKKGVPPEVIKDVLRCLELPDDKIEKIVNQVVWHKSVKPQIDK